MQLEVQPGTLLAAWPDLRDPNFMHAVVLLCQHSEDGAYGLVVNRPTEITLKELLPEHPTLGRVEFPVHLGGPVDHATLQFVHALPERIPGGFPLSDELWLGGELDALGAVLLEGRAEELARVRVLIGYSGWGAGQLDRELALGSWVPAAPDLAAVFDPDAAGTWRRVVASIGPEGRDLGRQPPDVSWN